MNNAAAAAELYARLLAGTPGPPGASSISTFVLRPGGVAGGNVYTTMAALYAALSTSAGSKTLQFDDSIVSPIVIPPGTYDFKDTILMGTLSEFSGGFNVNVQVHLPEGVVFVNTNDIVSNVTFTSFATATPVITMTNGQVFRLGRGAQVFNDVTGTMPFIAVPNLVQLPLIFLRPTEQWANGEQLGDFITPSVRMATGAQLAMVLGTRACLATNTLTESGPSTVLIDVQEQSALTTFGGSTPSPIVQVGITNLIIIQDGLPSGTGIPVIINGYLQAVAGNATNVPYVPANVANWTGVAPTSIANALDRIAAKITPIP
jgi:hypothetical protein